jgi:hypothetical protein
MKRARAGDDGPGPVVFGSREVVDVSGDTDAEVAMRTMQLDVVFQGSASPPSKMEIKEGKTTVQDVRRTLLGLRDAGQKITFQVGGVTIEFGQGGGLGTLFDLAAKESEEGGQSEVVANGYVAAPNGDGGIGAHGGVHVSARGIAGGAVRGRGGRGAGRGWLPGGGGVGGGGGGGGGGSSGGGGVGRGGGGRGGRDGQRQPLLDGVGSMCANRDFQLVEGGLKHATGLEANKRLLYEHFLNHKVSVQYFLDMAHNGRISTSWPAIDGGRAHLDGLIEFAERVKAYPSEDPFA